MQRTAAKRSRSQTMLHPRARALRWLQAHSSPRLLMSLILLATMGAGFGASYLLLLAGVQSPLLRYPLCVLVGWAVFLMLVSAWVYWHRRRYRISLVARRRSVAGETPGTPSIDLAPGGGGSGPSATNVDWAEGGRFGGAGASDSYAEPHALGFSRGDELGNLSGGGPLPDVDLDLDLGGDDIGGAIVLLVVVALLAAAMLGIAFYVIYSAPTFFVELLVDGGVGTWLYRRVEVRQRSNWLATAARRSILPVIVVLLMFTALGWTVQKVAPGAVTLSQAWQVLKN